MVEDGGIKIERGEVTDEQIKEIGSGDFYTVTEVADSLHYSYTYIIQLCQVGVIKAIKPIGGRWRIPKSEYNRIISEGIREEVIEENRKQEEKEERPAVLEIEFPPEQVRKQQEKKMEKVSQEANKGFLDFLFK